MIYAGIDAGSRAIKIALLDTQGAGTTGVSPVGQGIGLDPDRRDACRTQGAGSPSAIAVLRFAEAPQGPRPGPDSDAFFRHVLAGSGLGPGDVRRAIATGYARAGVTLAGGTITEITCHARGVRHLLPTVQTVIEIGGQDSKLLRLAPDGSVRDFAMNDRCAAGTGRFLEMVAQRLGCDLEALGELAQRSRKPAAISSMCAVFAETEIIGLLASGSAPSDVVAGAQAAIASRVSAMAGGKVAAPVAFTGGVARVAGMDRALGAVLACEVVIPPRPQFTGALGAALLAMREDGK